MSSISRRDVWFNFAKWTYFCCYEPTLSGSIVSISRLIADGYDLVIGTNDCFIRKNDIFFSYVLVENGLYVLDLEIN